MKRSRIVRHTPLRSSGRPKARSRSAVEKERIYGTADRIAWLKRQPCLCLGRRDHRCLGAIEVAHTENGGMGRKADANTTVPLCNAAHHLLHEIGVQSFQTCYGLDLKAEAVRIAAAWLAERGSE